MALARTESESAAVSLETLDDVVIDDAVAPARLVQVKRHADGGAGKARDGDVDTWRTVKVWLDATAAGEREALLYLVTNRTAADGSGLSKLRENAGDAVAALVLFDRVAGVSTNQGTAAARAEWLTVAPAERLALLRRVRVADRAPGIEDLRGEVRRALRHVLPADHADHFLGQLWSGWDSTVVRLLRSPAAVVTAAAFESYLSELRDGYTLGSLPSTVDEADVTGIAGVDHAGMTFVAQMRWVDTPETQVRQAIVDYYRAYLQVHDWVRNDLLGDQELERYEDRLRTQWRMAYDFMVADLPASATEQERQQAGRRLLLGALQNRSESRLRPQFEEDYFTRGTHHDLADRGGRRRLAPRLRVEGRGTAPVPGRVTAWSRRPTAKAALLNPALGAVLLTAAADAHEKQKGVGLDWPLAFLVLPLVVHEPTRRALPGNTRTHLPVWLQRHPLLRSQTSERAAGLTVEVREGMRHGLRSGVLTLDAGVLRATADIPRPPADIVELVGSARLLGRWFARYSTSTIFALFGVRP